MDNEKYRFLKTSFRLDRKLYKYYSNVSYAVDSIKNKRIHLDSPETFNDPFDCLYCLSQFSTKNSIGTTESIEKDIHNYITNVPKNKNPHYIEMINATTGYMLTRELDYSQKPISDIVREMYLALGDVGFSYEEFCDAIDTGYENTDGFNKLKVKVSCFSEVNDSVLMWSYYANSHNGVCVEYDLSKLDMTDSMNRRILNNLSKVHYSPIRADSLYSLSDEYNYLNFIVSKSSVWSHENEWRIICDTKEEFLPFDCISCVYLGVNFNTDSTKYKKLLDAVKKTEKLSIKKAVLNSSDFNISFNILYDGPFMYYLEEFKNKKDENNHDLQKI